MQPIGLNDILRFFFIAHGRIGRQEYLLGLGFIYAVNAALLSFALHQSDHDLALGLVIMISTFPSTVGIFVLSAKRCHDMGLPGSFVLMLVIPLIGLIWMFVLAIAAGTPGPNAYGAPPRFGPD
jgi:uncharacterized membrane protein YhaH (DUF805 family)